VNERIIIRTSADIDAIEQGGWEAFLPSATPFGLIENAARPRPDACALHYLANSDDPSSNVQISYGTLVHNIRQAANLFHSGARRSREEPAPLTRCFGPNMSWPF
jgi:hypothetical protein